MSTSSSKSAGELAPSAPVFSYAQAAKGQSPSVTASSTPAKSGSETSEITPKKSFNSRPEDFEATEIGTSEQGGKENHSSPNDSKDVSPSKDSSSSLDTPAISDSSAPVVTQMSESLSHNTLSNPGSPNYGTTSTSTLPKEDDVSATPNGSSESTWEKVSQTSNNEDKESTKVDGDDEDSKLTTWEHVPTPAQLKEAPLPAVNIWQKRAKDMQAKSGKELKGSQSLSSTNPRVEFGSGSGSRKDQDQASDNKKKPKTSPQGVDKKYDGPLVRGPGRSGEENISYRGTRVPEAVRGPGMVTPPPPPGDAISWPTPDIAMEEEKKKVLDRNEKGEKENKTAVKPHGKEKWVTVPYVPSAIFETPLPPGRRGGRLSRGNPRGGSFRGAHSVHASMGGDDKALSGTSGTSPASATQANDRNRGDVGPPRAGPPAPRMKRAVSAGPSIDRDKSRSLDTLTEKHSDGMANGHKEFQSTQSYPFDGRRTSATTQTEGMPSRRQLSPQNGRNENQRSRKPSQTGTERDMSNIHGSQDHAHPRSMTDRRSEGSMRSPETFRDSNGFGHPRDRGDGRPDRGRGGFRGRGGHNGYNNNSVNGPNFSKEMGHPSQAPPFVPSPREGRHYRANSRSHTLPNQNAPSYGSFPANGISVGSPSLPTLQTDMTNAYGYQPSHPGIMSAMPYHPYMEHLQLLGMVQMQMEYYFSVDNLCKDLFLRKHMDSQGFVLLSVLAKFNRIKQLTLDIDLIRFVCVRSVMIDLQTGVDGIDRIRKAEGWQQWVLNFEERDPAAQNEVPVVMQQQPQNMQAGSQDAYRGPGATNPLSPRASLAAVPYQMESPAFLPANGLVSSPSHPAQPFSNGQLSDAHITHTPLSAAVPDFTPQLHPFNRQASPSAMSDTPVSGENAFSDEQVESLMIVIRKPVNSTTPLRTPFPSVVSRTFSNGSIDSRTISDENFSRTADTEVVPATNGDPTPESRDLDNSQRSRSPFTFGSAPRQPTNSAPPVFWVKDKDTPIDDLPSDLTHESYTIFKRRALKQRGLSAQGHCHRDMDILFQFWSHFLIRNFNTRMYEEFRQLAFEDVTVRDSTVGIRNLVAYYDESILGKKAISDDLARDYVDLVKIESDKQERPAFDKLRAAWRNGAFPLNNRVKIDRILNADLKAELDT